MAIQAPLSSPLSQGQIGVPHLNAAFTPSKLPTFTLAQANALGAANYPMKPYTILLLLFCSGCSLLPSGWRWSTPITKLEKSEKKVEQKTDELLTRAQGAVHATGEALTALPDSREKTVALDFNTEATLLIDQSLGAPKAGDVLRWQKQVADLLSINTEIRARAEAERRATLKETARMAEELAASRNENKELRESVTDYAKKNEALADWLKKVLWVAGLGGGVWVFSLILGLAARFVPALAPISTAFHAVSAPALSYAYNRAQSGLVRAGNALAEIRAKAPEVAEKVTQYFDDHFDADHKQTVSTAAALAAHRIEQNSP